MEVNPRVRGGLGGFFCVPFALQRSSECNGWKNVMLKSDWPPAGENKHTQTLEPFGRRGGGCGMQDYLFFYYLIRLDKMGEARKQ